MEGLIPQLMSVIKKDAGKKKKKRRKILVIFSSYGENYWKQPVNKGKVVVYEALQLFVKCRIHIRFRGCWIVIVLKTNESGIVSCTKSKELLKCLVDMKKI